MRKTFFLTVVWAVSMILFPSCSDTGEKDQVPEINLHTTSITSTSPLLSQEGGSEKVSFTTNIPWTATSSTSWLSVSPSHGEAGDDTITLTTLSNTTCESRTGTITISGDGISKTISVTQNGAKATVSLSVSSIEISSQANIQSIGVNSNTFWTVSSDQIWCIASPVSGTGDQDFSISVSDNLTLSSRTATVIVTANTVSDTMTVTQNGAAANLSLSVTSLKMESSEGKEDVTVTSNAGWSVSSDQEWCTVSSATGERDGIFSIIVTENKSFSPRKAVVTVIAGTGQTKVATQTVTVTQNAADMTLDISENNFEITAAAGHKSLTVSSNTSWKISSNQPWCTATPSSGNGNGSIEISATENTSKDIRTATLTIVAGPLTKEIAITQKGVDQATLTLSISNLETSSQSSSGNVTVTSNSAWTVSSSQNWCIVSPITGNRDGAFIITTTTNTVIASRSASITVTAGSGENKVSKTISVIQQGVDQALLTLSINSLDISAEASDQTISVSSNMGWTVSSSQFWCTAAPASGSGNGTFKIMASANATLDSRSAIVTVTAGNGDNKATKTLTITQKAADVTLALSESALELTSKGGTKAIALTSNAQWSVQSNQSWCTIIPSYGNGNGQFKISASANASIGSRQATVKVISAAQGTENGVTKTITVTQTGVDPASLSLSVSTLEISSLSGSQTIDVTSNSSWSVSSDQGWCTIFPVLGNGNGSFDITIQSNKTLTGRTATITVTAGSENNTAVKTLTIIQKPADPTLAISVNSIEMAASSDNHDITVTSNAFWTVSSNQSWCSVTPSKGSGNSSFNIAVTTNATLERRTATITIVAGNPDTGNKVTKTITVTQDAAAAFLTFPQSMIEMPAAATKTTVTLSSNAPWTISCYQSWCTISPSTGTGNGSFSISISENKVLTARSATVTVTAGSGINTVTKTLTVTQKEADATLSLSRNSLQYGSSASTEKVTLTSNARWTATSNQTWCTISPGSGANDGTISISVTENTFLASRSATITVVAGNEAEQKIIVTQNGVDPATLTLSANTLQMDTQSSSKSVTVTSNMASWSAASDQDWCTVSPLSGKKNGSFTVSVSENYVVSTRSATITVVAGTGENTAVKTLTVTQAAAAEYLYEKTNTAMFTAGKNGENVSFSLVSNTGYSFTIDGNPSWITKVSDTDSGTATRLWKFKVNANIGSKRAATITFTTTGGKTLVVTIVQDGGGTEGIGDDGTVHI